MRLTITSGGRTVDLRTDPSEQVSLRSAEGTALRLFRALPAADNDTPENDTVFGFALSSDTERAPEPVAEEEADD